MRTFILFFFYINASIKMPDVETFTTKAAWCAVQRPFFRYAVYPSIEISVSVFVDAK